MAYEFPHHKATIYFAGASLEVSGTTDQIAAVRAALESQPELLAALESLVGGKHNEGDLYDPGGHARARAAIARAGKGRE